MARVHGKYNQVWFDSDPTLNDPAGGSFSPAVVLGVTRWTISEKGAADNATGADSNGAEQYTAGLHGWAAHVECFWDTSEAKTKGTLPKIAAGMCCKVNLMLASGSTYYYEGYGITTAVEVSVPVDGNITWTMDIQGSGNLSHFPA